MKKEIYCLEDAINHNNMYFGSLDEVLGRLQFVLNAESNYNFKNNRLNTYAIIKLDDNYNCLDASRPVTVGEWRWLSYDEKQDLINDIRLEIK